MRNVFIGCSSYNTIDRKYIDFSSHVADVCIKNNLNLIFGASNNGMMGEIYRKYYGSSLSVEGINIIKYQEDLKELNCKKTVFENTLKQLEYFLKSDILLFLPGGVGTLNEIISAITAKRNCETKAKIIIYNFEGYYDSLISLLNKFIEEGFSKKDDLFVIVNNDSELEQELVIC